LHGAIQEICLVDIRGLKAEMTLRSAWNDYLIAWGNTYQLFVKVDLNHRLNRVTDVNQFKELQ
jgi:hypothetical protein